jgi:Flp pilus assembly protein TadB
VTTDPRPLAALAGALIAAGGWAVAVGLYGSTEPVPATGLLASVRARLRRVRGTTARTADLGGRARRVGWRRGRALLAVAAGMLAWFALGWPVAGLVTAAAVFGLPPLLGASAAARRDIDRLEALEDWTRRLADVLSIGVGLEQAITASLRTAPAAIAPDVAALAARLGARWSTESALHAFADDLHDPTGDLVAAALLLGSRRRGPGLAAVLDGLAATVADEVSMRRKVEADRAKPRTTARWVTLITLAVVGLAVLNGSYVRPYGTALGQLVLAVLSLSFGAALLWMHVISRGAADPRFLPSDTPTATSLARERS